MGQNTRQLLQLILIVCAFTAVIVWAAPLIPSTGVLAIRIFAPIATIAMSWVVYKVSRMPGKYPDHLAAIRRRYFERTGLAFAPRFEINNGVAFLCFYFQNRYEREVYATMVMQPGLRSFRYARHPLPVMSMAVRCPGGGFGVARLPMEIPANLQGRKVRFEVAADIKYPSRRGKLLHQRGGLRVGPTSRLSQGRRLLDTLAVALFFGIIHEHRPAGLSLVLPSQVSDQPADRQRGLELLWQPPAAADASPPRLAA